MQRERARLCLCASEGAEKRGKKKVPMETKELYLIAITWPQRDVKIEDLKVAHTAVWMCLTLCLVLHLLMALYLFTGTDSFQSVQCNKWGVEIPHTYMHNASTHTHTYTHTLALKGAKRMSLHSL